MERMQSEKSGYGKKYSGYKIKKGLAIATVYSPIESYSLEQCMNYLTNQALQLVFIHYHLEGNFTTYYTFCFEFYW